MSEGKYKAQAKWQKKNTKNITIRFYKTSESDVIAHLEKNKPNGPYIKGLIKKDMESAES